MIANVDHAVSPLHVTAIPKASSVTRQPHVGHVNEIRGLGGGGTAEIGRPVDGTFGAEGVPEPA